MLSLQRYGLDPGWSNVITASSETKYTSKANLKANVESCTAGRYFQMAHVTTSKAKGAKWQADSAVYRDIVVDLQQLSLKTTTTTEFEVGFHAISCTQQLP